MGFWDLHAFNLAIFEKQAWKLIYEPQSLLSRVFKAKCFPSTEVLQDSTKAGMSFAWHSLLAWLRILKIVSGELEMDYPFKHAMTHGFPPCITLNLSI